MTRSKKLPVALVVVGTLLLSTTGAEAGGVKSKMKSMFKTAPKPVVVVPAPAYVPAPVYVPTPFVPAPVVRAPFIPVPVHTHAYQAVAEQVWVPPVYSSVVVGYDFFGRPVHQQTVSTPGYYRTVTVLSCACGRRQSP